MDYVLYAKFGSFFMMIDAVARAAATLSAQQRPA
jgi:hypothetical protein